MNAKKLIPAALLVIAGAAGSVSAFAGQMGNEITEAPQAQSSLTRAQVVAETRAAMAQHSLERTSYDEQESVAVARQQQAAPTTTRAQVRADTQAFFKAHPNSEYELETYGIGG